MAHTTKPRSTLTKIAIALGVLTAGTVALGGCAVDPADDEEVAVDGAGADVSPDDLDDEDGDEETASSGSALGGCYQCTNCVKYARCRQRRLPYGLTYWRDKLNIINSRTPRVGCVAVIKTGSAYGHVAYVKRVSGSTVSIDEGNWGRRCNSRSGTASQLRIQGYWCP